VRNSVGLGLFRKIRAALETVGTVEPLCRLFAKQFDAEAASADRTLFLIQTRPWLLRPLHEAMAPSYLQNHGIVGPARVMAACAISGVAARRQARGEPGELAARQSNHPSLERRAIH